MVNIFEPNSKSGKFLNSEVQRCQILTITEDVPESNFDLRTILDNLNLQDVVFSLAFDLKFAKANFGLSSHAGKRACLMCEGLATSEPGVLRSLESLEYWYNEYSKTGHDNTKMKDCMNVINPRILYKDEDPKSLHSSTPWAPFTDRFCILAGSKSYGSMAGFWWLAEV